MSETRVRFYHMELSEREARLNEEDSDILLKIVPKKRKQVFIKHIFNVAFHILSVYKAF